MIRTDTANPVRVFDNPEHLPREWENLFQGSLFYDRSFIVHLKKTNLNYQSYFWAEDSKGIAAGCLYKFKWQMAARISNLGIATTVCGLPLSVALPGFMGSGDYAHLLEKVMNGKGLKAVFNIAQTEKGIFTHEWALKRTMPDMGVTIKHRTWEEYLNSMKYRYRQSILRSRARWDKIDMHFETEDNFTPDHYKMYLDAWSRSPYRLEKMEYPFFKELPWRGHRYLSAYRQGQLIGWSLVVPDGKIAYELFAGYAKGSIDKFHAWRNLQCEAIRYAIENGFSELSLGQTAETGKNALGAVPREKFSAIRHGNKAINAVIKATRFLANRRQPPEMHVFKNEQLFIKGAK